MSGEKYSEYRLQQARAERLQLVQHISSRHAELQGLRRRVAESVAGVSDGLRNTFSTEIREAQRWVGSTNPYEIGVLNVDSGLESLQSAQQTLNRIISDGRDVSQRLTVALTQKADVLGRRLATRLTETQQAALARQQVIRLWHGQQTVEDFERRIKDAERLLQAEEYNELERTLTQIDAELTNKADVAERQEEKHQKRLYLLRALRQTCQEMAFEEVVAPGDPPEEDRGSPMIYKVDTFDRGMITFRLSLEGISSFAEVAEDRCFEEFNAVSEYLEENFGIETEFRMADGSPMPHGRQKGEKGEPTGIDRRAGMSGGLSH